MTTTLDIPTDLLARARELTASSSDQEAVVKVLEQFARDHDKPSQAAAIALLGTFESLVSDDEFGAMRK